MPPEVLMPTIALSENAVAVLRFRVKGWRFPIRDQDLPAYWELVAARFMEPAGEDFRFTEEGWARREELLREAEERIERERYDPPDVSNLSESAREVLRCRLAGDREVTDANRPFYRELVAARIMIPVHAFIGGSECDFHFTYWGWERRFEFVEMSCANERVGSGDTGCASAGKAVDKVALAVSGYALDPAGKG
jgi:hypothetical protein